MAVEFKEEFISQITGDGKTRPEALREANIVDIINNRTDLSDTVKANKIKVVESLGVSGITLGDIADNTPAADTMYKNIVQQGFSNRLDSFIADFRGLLSEVGVLGKQTENPLRSRIVSAVGQPTLVDGAKDIASRILGNKTIKQVALPIAAGVATAASEAKSMLPGPVEGMVTGIFDQESMREAEQIGKKIGQDISGQEEGVIPALGGAAGVAAEMITGGVADPEAPVRSSQFLASPMATIASGFINRDKETAPADMYKGGFLSN